MHQETPLPKKTPTVSVVMCTYNGEAYLRQQLDSLLRQTYPLMEIIIQDDHSTDHTAEIAEAYGKEHPHIRLSVNPTRKGINNNFISAFAKARGEYIAVCDQDDIWEPEKIEKQMATIHGHLLCTCRSRPFSDTGEATSFDPRTPNYHLIRLLYCSIPGHTILFHRRLLTLMPMPTAALKTYYDVYLSLTAAAYGSLVLTDEVLVHQRRHPQAATYEKADSRRSPSMANGLYILWWSVTHQHEVRPAMREYFRRRQRLLQGIKASTPLFEDAKHIIALQTRAGLCSLLRLSLLHLKHRHHLFYTEGSGIVNFFRAMLYCVMQVYNYRYLIRRGKSSD